MPTVAEPIWPGKEERRTLCITEFVRARPGDVDDSLDVLRARLFGLGLRLDDLRLEVSRAQEMKATWRRCPLSGAECRRIALTGNCPCRSFYESDFNRPKTA